MPDTLGESLRRSEPDLLVATAAAHVAALHPGTRVDALLADYRIAGLWPVLHDKHDSQGSLADQSGAARAFASQDVVIEPGPQDTIRALIPLTVWHDRIGVLVVDVPSTPDALMLQDLRTVADQLAVALMAADKATDLYRRTRRRHRLTMAAEMQWEMLPGRALGGSNFSLAGQLEPAYAVSGDHFDWSLNGDRLTITALNGDGDGLAATVLTVVAVNAMRNARRSGASLIEQAELASDALYSLHAGRRHVATLLIEVDLIHGTILLIDAGSPRMLRMRGTQIAPVQVDQQLPLGMFADARYALQQITMEPQDRLFIVSDGVHAATPPNQAPFGDRALLNAARATRLQPATEAVGSVMRELHNYHQDNDLTDDAVIVCLDWLGSTGGK